MIQLHVWGQDQEVSPVFPECVASAWLLGQVTIDEEFEIVTSSNTNVAATRALPVLIASDGSKHHGYIAIARLLLGGRLPSLIDYALANACLENLQVIHLYNLFVCGGNYEGYTRPQFQKYLPFPMMYNQPLQLHTYALERVRLAGLGPSSTGLLGFIKDNEETNEIGEKTRPLSALHEKLLLSKAKKSSSIQETKLNMKCSRLLTQYLTQIISIYREQQGEQVETLLHPLSGPSNASIGEILLCAYVTSLQLKVPNQAISNTIAAEFPQLAKFATTQTSQYNREFAHTQRRVAIGDEAPTFFNEVKRIWSLRGEYVLW